VLRLGSVCSYPDRLVDCLKGSAGTGRRLLDVERVQASQKPFEGQPRSPHPNRLVWTWVEVRPVRFFAWGQSGLRGGFSLSAGFGKTGY
jgi:hypothetical protein